MDHTNEESAARDASSYIPDTEWLAKHCEPIIDPDLPIIDTHHHLWDYPGSRYLFDEVMADLNTGHNVQATVHVQCGSMYSADTEPDMAPIGETEFVNGIAATSASGLYGSLRVAKAIVGYADFSLGDDVASVLEAHLKASQRFRGVRHMAVYDPDPLVTREAGISFVPGLLGDSRFRQGFSRLAGHDLSFETWIFHTQIDELADLARAFPDTSIILDHAGTPIRIGPYVGQDDQVHAAWLSAIQRLANHPNVTVKISGLTMPALGFELAGQPMPPSSEQLAALWRPWVEPCIEAFGSERCMFGSNFPVEKISCSFPVLWNAFKILTNGFSREEINNLFSNTARRIYRI